MTNLTKLSPLFGSIDQAWDAFYDPSALTYSNKTRGLSYEIKPSEDAVIAEVEVPGCSPSDVKVSCEGRAIQVETPRGNAYFTVGARIDMDNIEASIQHGLLRLRVPKREAKKVEIKVLEQES
jgi:HSP20 family molecular chaperone IbpA